MTETTTMSQKPPLGESVTLAAGHLQVYRQGTKDPTIVVLPGAGMVGLGYLNLLTAARLPSTILAYDRAGTGWSHAAELPRKADAVTDELRELLAVLGVASPVVLVGHSLGGGYAQHFARRFPDLVGGLVLLDPAHEDFPKYEPPEMAALSAAFRDAPLVDLPAEVLEGYRAEFEARLTAWPADVRQALISYHLAHWRTGVAESSNVDVIYAEMRSAPPLAQVPLIVMTSMGTDPASAHFVPLELQERSMAGKLALHQSIAASVPGSEHVVLENATHAWLHIEAASAVTAAIDRLVAGAR